MRSIDKSPIMESEVITVLDEKDIQYLQEMEKRILEQSAANMRVLLEGIVDPKFGLLADGLKLVQEKMLPVEALDDAEDRLDVLEAVVRRHSREIEKLKKAQ